MRQIWVALFVMLFVVESKAQMYFDNGDWIYNEHTRITSVSLVDGKLFVEKREQSMIRYPEGGGPPDKVWKEIYCASNGVIVLERKVEGVLIPQQTTPEHIDWPDKESQKVPQSPWLTYTNLSSTNGVYSNICLYGKINPIRIEPYTYEIFGMKFIKDKDGELVLKLDGDIKMNEAVSNLLVEIRKQLEIKK